jgi:hypothetical protein
MDGKKEVGVAVCWLALLYRAGIKVHNCLSWLSFSGSPSVRSG